MICPNCSEENNDAAKFCKKCGTPLKRSSIHDGIVKKPNESNNNMKILLVALIIIVLVIAGSLIYFYGFNHENSSENIVSNTTNVNDEIEQVTPKTTELEDSTTSMEVLGGTFETGSELSDKTYASIYVGSQHAGEEVKIQIKYSRDGDSLNNGNKVLKTVTSDGYINVRSANSFNYFPDFAEINIFDTDGNLLTTKSVTLSPVSGTQSF